MNNDPQTIAGLFEAIARADEAVVDEMLKENQSLASARNDQGVSAPLWALYQRQGKIAEQIAAAGAELDVFDAAGLGHVDRLSELLEADSSLAQTRAADGATALHLACFFGRVDAVRVLLDHDSALEAVAPSFGNVTPLHSAAAGGSAEIVRVLLEAGADPKAIQAGGYTALHSAAQLGDIPMAQALLEHGAETAIQTDDGKTVADFARDANQTAIIELLNSAT